MSLALKLANLADSGKPVRVGLIGAGKFGSMFLSQAPRTPGLHVLGIADRDVGRSSGDREGRLASGAYRSKIVRAGAEDGLNVPHR